jgi:cold shock CspA family protein
MLEVPNLAAVNTVAVVHQFKRAKGYGFVEVPEISETAFVHAATVARYGFDELFDGDELRCDVQRTGKGLAVGKIYSVKRPSSQVYRGKIVKLFSDRHYGFIHITDLRTDAIFYYDIFPLGDQKSLAEGQYLSFEIKTDRSGRSQVRRIIA